VPRFRCYLNLLCDSGILHYSRCPNSVVARWVMKFVFDYDRRHYVVISDVALCRKPGSVVPNFSFSPIETIYRCVELWRRCSSPVMWSEIVGLKTRPVWEQKSVLVLQVWCCVVKHDLVTLIVIMILKDTATFQVLFIVSLFCVWNITTVEITYLKVKFAKCLCLLPVVLVLVLLFRSWSWSWSCKQRSWS